MSEFKILVFISLIFNADNHIRETLQQRLVSSPTLPARVVGSPDALNHARNHIATLHEKAKHRCHLLARKVVAVIKENLGTAFFEYDASLVRDGCFFAAVLLAKESGSTEEVESCLQAMQEMRWVFSKSDERTSTVQMMWHSRVQQMQATSMGPVASGSMVETVAGVAGAGDVLGFGRRPLGRSVTIPPLTIPTGASSSSSSAPSTSATGERSWPSATSSSRPHSGSTSSLYATSPIVSRTSSYGSLTQLTGSVPHAASAKDPMLALSSGMHGTQLGQGLSYDRPGEAYYQPYRYMPPSGGSSSQLSLPQQTDTPMLMLPSYPQLSYTDSVMQFTNAPMDTSTEHMLSPTDGDDETGVLHPPTHY